MGKEKPKASQNKAENVEINPQRIEELYAQIGRLQIQREQGLAVAQTSVKQAQKIYQQIQALEREKK